MSKSIIFHELKSKVNSFDFPKCNTILFKINNLNNIDVQLNSIVFDNLYEVEYDNIIIPLCFGNILSDFLGLRLATHIRTSETLNKTKNIFIYSFVALGDLVENECFGIIKSKGVFLVNYNYKDLLQASIYQGIDLKTDELVNEVKKVDLKVSSNNNDNHNIANEWAIVRWSKSLGVSDSAIEKIKKKVENDLYFKYLSSIYSNSNLKPINKKELSIENKGKVLYIDDEAEKGWFELFTYIIYDINQMDFVHLDEQFNEHSQVEIIDICLEKIKSFDPELVILDFRLHKSDLYNNIKEVTGYQILNKIKEFNKGIQVIIFSATNKIWNLQALQEAGSDGFIIKESPENSVDPEFTIESIQNMIKSIDSSLGMMFLKEVCNNIDSIKLHLLNVSNDCDEKEFEKLLKMKFKNEIFIQLDIIYDCLKKSSIDISTIIKDENSYLNLSFISIFKIIELINDFYTNEKGDKLRSGRENIQNYDQNLNAFNNITNQYPSTREKIMTIINFELNESPIIFVSKINQFIKFRNNIIHPKTLKDYKKTSKEENLEFLKLVKSILVKIK